MSQYREDPQRLTIHYERNTPPRISKEVEHNIVKELFIEKRIIENKEIPLKSYNYSFIKDRLRKKYHQKVSLTTVIRGAKEHGFYLKKPERTLHDREVLTRYVGELIKHNTFHHLWAPAAKKKWYPITSLNDYSRHMHQKFFYNKGATL